jgi:hypothetical protein
MFPANECNHDFPAGSEYAPEARCARCHRSRLELTEEIMARERPDIRPRARESNVSHPSSFRELTPFEQNE